MRVVSYQYINIIFIMNNNPVKAFLIRLRLKAYKKNNCVYYKELNFDQKSTVIFDFSDINYVHFGDILFYLPSVRSISRSYQTRVLANSENYSFLSHFLNDVEIIREYKYSLSDIVITSPYSLFKNQLTRNIIGLGLPNEAINCIYPMYLFLKISNILKLKSSENTYYKTINDIKSEEIKKMSKEWGSNSVLVSPFISSGKFRDLLSLKRKRILIKASNMNEKSDIKTILVGSKHDLNIKLKFNSTYDLRGKSIIDIMSIVRNKNIISGIGFDNFWMHYFNLIGKPYETIFRGRFTKIHHENHINFINKSFI